MSFSQFFTPRKDVITVSKAIPQNLLPGSLPVLDPNTVTTADIYKEIVHMRRSQDSFQESILKTISHLKEELRAELRAQIVEEVGAAHAAGIAELREHFGKELQEEKDRMEAKSLELEDKIQQLSITVAHSCPDSDVLDNTDVTVIANKIPKTILTAEAVAMKLIAALALENEVTVVKAKFLGEGRHSETSTTAPLLKVSLRSKDEKIKVLRKKETLKQTEFKDVTLRTSKTHIERVVEQNSRTILSKTEWGNAYRIAASGKIMLKTPRQAPEEAEPVELLRGPPNRGGHAYNFYRPPFTSPIYPSQSPVNQNTSWPYSFRNP